jgi:hypothetical protein
VKAFQIDRLVGLELRDGDGVDPSTTVVLLHLLPGQRQIGATLHLVNQGMDFSLPWLVLR